MIATFKLVNDELSIKEDKATKDQETQPQLNLNSVTGRGREERGGGD